MFIFSLCAYIISVAILLPRQTKNTFTILRLGILSVIFLSYGVYYVSDTFTGEGITAGVLYHIQQLHTVITPTLLGAYIPLILIILCAGSIYTIGYWYFTHHAPSILRRVPSTFGMIFLGIALLTHPIIPNIRLLMTPPSVDITVLEQVAPLLRTGTTTPDITAFDTYYAANTASANTSTPQKNIVLLYLEGGEATYSTSPYIRDLTPNLDRLSNIYTTFSALHQIDQASYTIGGMVASQCGLPLFSSTSNELHAGIKTSFLSGATCLGDILQSAGYTNTYIGGADGTFAGKDTFLRSHGFDTIIDKEDLIQAYDLNIETDVHNWGVYDETLFDAIKDTFFALSESDTPFLLSSLTLDTHPPKGYVSPRCIAEGVPIQKSSMRTAVACTDYLVGSLVDAILASPYADNTIIVIASDHLAMEHDMSTVLNKTTRTNRLLIIDPSEPSGVSYPFYGTTLDTATTILSFIGFTGRVGLGYDLRDERLTPLRQAVTTLHNQWFFDVIALWEPPLFVDDIHITTTTQEITIGSQAYSYPIFVNFTTEWESAVTFRYAQAEESLLSYPAQMEPNKSYLLIDLCTLFEHSEAREDEYCIAYGSANEIVTVEPIAHTLTTISKKEFIEKANVSVQL